MYKIQSFTLSLFLLFKLSTGWASSWPEPIFIRVADGLEQPVHLTDARDGSERMYIVEQPGRIKILKDNNVQENSFLDITDRVSSGGEKGLLSIAFPLNYEDKKYFYVNYTNILGNTTVSRFQLGASEDIADSESEEIILTVEQPFSNHNGGQLAFGPDGFLYIAMGDGGSGGDPLGSGQNGNTLLGKMLRIDVESGTKPYAIPDTNPFLLTAEFRPEIWALGLRNPWRFSFDRETGDLYIADVGQNQFEEVNVQFASSTGGENYGWNIMEALHCFNSTSCEQSGLTTPVLEYGQSQGDKSITGGLVYRGKEFPRMQGMYFFADFVSGRMAGLRWTNNQWQSSVLANTEFSISSFGEDGAGHLYLVDLSGSIYRIEDNIRLNQLAFEDLLSQYQAGDSLQLSLQEADSNRTESVDLWVVLQHPNGNLVFITSDPTKPFAQEPQPFIRQLETRTINHSILNIIIPDEITKGTYTFYAIFNKADSNLNDLLLTLRSNIAQVNTVVID
jgi:glucose/arabinose dehydrogenase